MVRKETKRAVNAFDTMVQAMGSYLDIPGDTRAQDIQLRREFPGKHPKITADAATEIAKQTDEQSAMEIAIDAIGKVIGKN